ncbi:hypothetical protein EDE08_103501 [Bradyrhizobium sp. R2.2-H]|jgi:hypothetical protein|nr:hypothetical protein EDE10_103500 [Bradyrhizobium sp. Y-H1]TCU78049.1 hypothetical protein EDE08_103501 [Bradyrhizobium sp. R2.2-H]
MRGIGAVLSWVWSAFGLIFVFCAGMQAGQLIGYGARRS